MSGACLRYQCNIHILSILAQCHAILLVNMARTEKQDFEERGENGIK
jgi:hypothetical protein